MQLTFLQENIQNAIQDLQKAVPHRPSLPILGCILMESLDEKTLRLSATDLNIGISVTIPAEVKTIGKAAVPAKIFADFIGSLGPGKMSLTLNDHELRVEAERSKASLPCLNPQDFPSFPEKDGEPLEIETVILTDAIQNCGFAASVDEARPALTSILFETQADKTVRLVTTDGFRLATLLLTPDKIQLLTEAPLLVPAKALQEVIRIVGRHKTLKIRFQVSQKLRQVFFTIENVEVLVRLMDSEFPPYQKIMPSSFITTVVFDGEEFNQRLKTASIFARDSSGIIRFIFQEGKMKIISASSSLGQQESELEVEKQDGPDQEIAFNIKYLSDFLSVVKPTKIWFGMNESLKPAVFRPADTPDYTYVVMPFRVNS
jgi:DNA polymerase-3 subunit beta